MKKQNIDIPHNQLQDMSRSILIQKVQFYQNQLKQSNKRESSLKVENENLKKSINQLFNDKNKILSFITNKPAQNNTQLLKSKIKTIESGLNKKIQELTFLNKQYTTQICRLEDQLKNQVRQLTDKHAKQKQMLEKKINKYEITIKKYHKICSQIEPSCFKDNIMIQNQNIKKQNECLKNKIKQFQNNETSHNTTQNFSYLIPQSNFHTNTNQSFYSNDIPLKSSFQKDNSSYINDIQNSRTHINRKLNESLNITNRISINKEKSRLSNCSSIKPKSIATTLYCQECERDYPPNQFYCHMKIHTKNINSSTDRSMINHSCQKHEQQSLDNIFVVVKNHKKYSPSSNHPYKMR